MGKDLVQGLLDKMTDLGIVHAEDGYYRVDIETLKTVALPRYLGVKKNEE